MAIVYTQTDTDPTTCATYNGGDRQATDGGTAGSSEFTFGCGSTQGSKTIGFRIPLIGTEDGAAGTWTIRFSLTTAEMNASLNMATFSLRRYTSGCSQTNLEDGSPSPSSILCDSIGTKTITITGLSFTPAAGDVIEIGIGVFNSSSHSATLGITPSVNIDSPLSIVDTPAGWGRIPIAPMLARRHFFMVP